jgi:hypothetical protein
MVVHKLKGVRTPSLGRMKTIADNLYACQISDFHEIRVQIVVLNAKM